MMQDRLPMLVKTSGRCTVPAAASPRPTESLSSDDLHRPLSAGAAGPLLVAAPGLVDDSLSDVLGAVVADAALLLDGAGAALWPQADTAAASAAAVNANPM